MIVSLLRFRLDLEGMTSIKDKRRIVTSLKDRLQRKFKLSVAEVDLQDSLTRAEIGAAIVSNSRTFGEMVLQKALALVENDAPGRVAHVEIGSERY
jgi:uncharacterized protein YlxP (DUF503 family)